MKLIPALLTSLLILSEVALGSEITPPTNLIGIKDISEIMNVSVEVAGSEDLGISQNSIKNIVNKELAKHKIKRSKIENAPILNVYVKQDFKR